MSVKKNNRGTTMVEVLVAIVVVLLVTASFSKLMSVSMRMFSNSAKIMKETQRFNELYYTKDAIDHRTDIQEGLSLCVDTTRTNTARNMVADPSVELKLNTDCSVVYWLFADNGYKMYSVGEAAYLIAAASEAPPTPSEAPTDAPAASEIPTPEPTPSVTPSEAPTEPAATEAPTLPGTDIVLVDNYWPKEEDYPQDESRSWFPQTVEPGGIFKWTDGKYYIVHHKIEYLNYSNAMLGPGVLGSGEFSDKDFSYAVMEIKLPIEENHRILTRDDFNDAGSKEGPLYRGDFCKVVNEDGSISWYLFCINADDGQFPLIDTDQAHWYKMPMD